MSWQPRYPHPFPSNSSVPYRVIPVQAQLLTEQCKRSSQRVNTALRQIGLLPLRRSCYENLRLVLNLRASNYILSSSNTTHIIFICHPAHFFRSLSRMFLGTVDWICLGGTLAQLVSTKKCTHPAATLISLPDVANEMVELL